MKGGGGVGERSVAACGCSRGKGCAVDIEPVDSRLAVCCSNEGERVVYGYVIPHKRHSGVQEVEARGIVTVV